MFITLQSHSIELLSEHALHLPEHSALVLSDVHLGKAAAFRAHGLAVPDGDNSRDLQRISGLLKSTCARHLIIAGDFLHAPESRYPELNQWISSCPAEITLVIGNHDRRSLPKNFPIPGVQSLSLGPIEIIHDPADATSDQLSICGHIHPAIRIQDGPRRSIRSACFHLSGTILTLPSFGSFTGGSLIRPQEKDRIFISLNGRVAEIPPDCWSKRRR